MHSITDKQTDEQTDRQDDDANSRSYRVAVRSDKCKCNVKNLITHKNLTKIISEKNCCRRKAYYLVNVVLLFFSNNTHISTSVFLMP